MDKLNFDINQFLRFLLAGGWAIACYFFINPIEFKKIGEVGGLNSIAFALIIGSIIYIIHRSLLYPNIYKLICFILFLFGKKKWNWAFIIPFYPSHTEIEDDFRRWSLRKKNNSFSSKHIIEWGSQVHFLYCSAFACLASILISKAIGEYNCQRAFYIFVLFWILFSAGLINNFRLVLYDLQAESLENKFNG